MSEEIIFLLGTWVEEVPDRALRHTHSHRTMHESGKKSDSADSTDSYELVARGYLRGNYS
jgi:hypothetical protein